MVKLRLKLKSAHTFILNHYTVAASQLSPAGKDKSYSRAVTGQLMEKLKRKTSAADFL